MPRRLLLRNAEIVTMDPKIGDLRRGDVLVNGGTIEAVGTDIAVPGDGGLQIVGAQGAIVLPGLIDAHNCVWQTVLRGAAPDMWDGSYFNGLLPLRRHFRAQDNFNAGYIGGFEMLSHGTTTVVDYCHNIRGPGFARTAIQGLAQSGIRTVFTYSFLDVPGSLFRDERERFEDALGVFEEFHDPASLVTLHFGIDSVGADGLERQLAFMRERGVHGCVHANAMNDIGWLGRHGLLGNDLIAVHGNLISNPELEQMAVARMPICFTPGVDVQGTPADVVRRAAERDVPVIFGCDVPCHMASDMWQQLRAMFYVQGFIDGAMERSFGVVPTRRPLARPGLPLLRPRDLLRSATIGAAQALGLQDVVGSISPGKRADLVIVDKGAFGDSVADDPCAHLLLQCSSRDVRDVIVDGSFRKRDGQLVDYDHKRADALLRESRLQILS